MPRALPPGRPGQGNLEPLALLAGGAAPDDGVDRILAVNEAEVPDLAGLWRAVWETGSAGCVVTLTLGRGTRVVTVPIQSRDRLGFLKAPRMH